MSRFIISSSGASGVSVPLAYLSEDVQASPSLSTYPVRQVEHYKEKNTVGHEFLVISVSNGTGLSRIRIERRPSTKKPTGFTILGGSSYERVTDDSLSRVAADFDPSAYYHISTAVCAAGLFTLGEMCYLCSAISKLAPNYRLSTNNCYWFCAAFLSHLRSKPGISFVEAEDHRRGGTFLRGLEVIDESSVKKEMQEYTSAVHLAVESGRKSNIQPGKFMEGFSERFAKYNEDSEASNIGHPSFLTSTGAGSSDDYLIRSDDSRSQSPITSPGGRTDAPPTRAGFRGLLTRMLTKKDTTASSLSDAQEVEVTFTNCGEDVVEVILDVDMDKAAPRKWVVYPNFRIPCRFTINTPHNFLLKCGRYTETMGRIFTKSEQIDVSLYFD